MSKCYRSWVVAFLGLALFFGGCNGAGEGAKDVQGRVDPVGQAQGKAKAEAVHEGPYLTVDRAVHDFGEVEPGGRVQCTFTLTNSGTEPLKIQKVKTTCGCTVVKLKKYTLAAGESEDLEVKLTAPSREGRTSKSLAVLVSPPGKPLRVPLSLRAEVRPTIKVEPAPLTLELRGEQKVSGTVTLTSRGGEAFSVTGFRGQGNLSLLYEEGSREAVHKLTVEGEALKLTGRPSATLIIETDHPKKKTVPLQVKVIPPFSSRPTSRAFLNMKAGESRTSMVTVFSNFDEAFELGSDISSRNGYVTVSKVTQVDEKTYRLDLEMTVPAETKGTTLRDEVTIPIKGYPDYSVKVNCYVRLGQKK